MHLHGQTLEKYVSGDLPPRQLATLDEHVSNCMFCLQAFAHEGATTEQWERRGWLGRLVRVQAQPTVAEDEREELEARAA